MPLKGLKIELELHRLLRKAAADEGETIQAIAEEAIRARLLCGEKKVSKQIPPSTNLKKELNAILSQSREFTADERGFIRKCLSLYPEHAVPVSQLADILTFGDEGVLKAILSNLAVFLRLVPSERAGDGVPVVKDPATCTERINKALGRADRTLKKEKAATKKPSRDRKLTG